jgi:hypothetical protein
MAAKAVLSIKRQRNVHFKIFFQIIISEDYEIILKDLSTSGSVIIVNKNLDFVSVFIHQ